MTLREEAEKNVKAFNKQKRLDRMERVIMEIKNCQSSIDKYQTEIDQLEKLESEDK
jgi:hypothetical protein